MLEVVNLILPWAAFHLRLNLRASTWSWLEQLCLEPGQWFTLTYTIKTPLLVHISLISWFNKYQYLELCKFSWHDWYLGLDNSLALLHYIRYLNAKSSTYSSPMYGSSRSIPCWSFFNHHHDPHNSLCLQWAYVDNPWNVDVEEYILMF
jgi:hypothetical protein